MSIKTFQRIVFSHAFKQTFKDDALRRVGNILHCRYKFDTVVAQRLFVHRHLVLVARKSVELIHEYIIPRLFGAVFEHSLKIGAVIVRACHGTVDISVENKNVVAFRILIAHTDLPFDGLFCLPLAGIARIDDCDIFLWTLFNYPILIVLKEYKKLFLYYQSSHCPI